MAGFENIPAGRRYKVGRKVIEPMLEELFTNTAEATTIVLGAGDTSSRPANAVGVTAVAAQGTLTIAEPVVAAEEMTVGSVTYTFVADGTATVAGEIDLGADEAATKVNIVAALDGSDGLNTANTAVTVPAAFTGDDLVITAASAGVVVIPTSDTFTGVGNEFDGVALGTTRAGVDEVVAVGTIGSMYFDTTLGNPIWWAATGWVDATGTAADGE